MECVCSVRCRDDLRADLQQAVDQADRWTGRRSLTPSPSDPPRGRSRSRSPVRRFVRAPGPVRPNLNQARGPYRPAPAYPSRRLSFGASADADKFARVENLILGLGQQLDQVTRAQAEARRPQLSRPLLAAVDALLPELSPDSTNLELIRRCFRIADSVQDTDERVAAVLPALWQQVQLHPSFGDNKLLAAAVDNLPVSGLLSGQALGGHTLLQPVAARGLAGAPGLSSGGLSSPQRFVTSAASGASNTTCFRCGRYDHDRAAACEETTTRNGEVILPGQKARFAPAQWKARYGFDSKGYAVRKADDHK